MDFRALFRRKRAEEDLDDELQFHLAMQARKNQAAGLSDAEARHRATRQFGGWQQAKEECRDARGLYWIDTLLQDIRYAFRSFRRAPTFAITVVATIALGLGINTAVFTVLNAFYLRPLAVHDPYSLYEVYWTDRTGGGWDFTWPEHQEFLAQNPAFSETLAFHRAEARVNGRGLSGILVTADYFRMLGVDAAFGRMLLPEDVAVPGSQPVVVLSHEVWQSQFAGDPEILGRKVLLRGYPFQVVGVAPRGFNGLGARPTDFWAPLTMAARFDAGPDLFGTMHPRLLSIVGRLKPGFTTRQAQLGLTLWAQRFTASAPVAERAVGAGLVARATSKPFGPKNVLVFSLVMIAFSMILAIACANVANMMLARAMSRQREIGIRLSLGAARGRLIRQLLTESIVLVLPAAVAGILVSQGIITLCVRVLIATLPPGIGGFASKIPELLVDTRVAAFNLGAALLSAVVFGLAPALQATRINVMQASHGTFGNEFRRASFRNALVVGQITICVVMLITAAILLRGIGHIQTLDTILSTRDAIEIAVREKSRSRVIERLLSTPDVETIAAAHNAPVDRKIPVKVGLAEGGARVGTASNNASPEYFSVFEIPIVRGRNFTTDEARTAAAVAIVSESLCKQLWPNQAVGESAIGQSLRVDPGPTAGRTVTVIGIARDEISRWISNGEEKSIVYFPSAKEAVGNQLFVRVHGDADLAKRRMDNDLTSLDPNAIENILRVQIQQWVWEETYSFRVMYWGTSSIGILALLLTLSGVYGVLSYVVSQRTKEIGIRIALGATTGAVTSLFLKQSMRLGLIGAFLGSVLALGISKILAASLVMINTFSATAYLGGSLLVLAACAAAAYFPSRRAARIDPLTMLRYD